MPSTRTRTVFEMYLVLSNLDFGDLLFPLGSVGNGKKRHHVSRKAHHSIDKTPNPRQHTQIALSEFFWITKLDCRIVVAQVCTNIFECVSGFQGTIAFQHDEE